MNIHRVKSNIASFNNLGRTTTAKGINRLAFTHNERLAALKFSMYCQEAGMSVRFDEIGNVIARKPGKDNNLPPVVIGSHIDTVPEGGEYDGLLGVVAGLEVVRHLNDMSITTDHPIEVIAFTCEESARFNVATVGSKFLCGMLSEEDMKELKDKEGESLYSVIQSISSAPIESAKTRQTGMMKAFIELHIEQGPILENKNLDIGVVTHIAAPHRFKVHLKGTTSHSGATPMPMRKDCVSCGSEIVLEVERIANEHHQSGIVGTVGGMNIHPNTMNAIAGDVTLLIDVRGIDMDVRGKVTSEIMNQIELITKKRGIRYTIDSLGQEQPTKLSEKIADIEAQKCEQNGYSYRRMFSGAGHDAMNMAHLCPTSMIFIPCKDGISHSPLESVTLEQIEKGINILTDTVLEVASRQCVIDN